MGPTLSSPQLGKVRSLPYTQFACVKTCVVLVRFVESLVMHLSQFPLSLCFVFEFCVFSLGLENRATSVPSQLPDLSPSAYSRR